MNDDQRKRVAEIEHLARQLGELKEHPSWGVLTRIMEAKRQAARDRFTRELWSGTKEFNQREFDYERGYWAGAKWILDNPEKAEQSFERASRWAEALSEENQ